MSDRTPPPPIEVRAPDCPICWKETDYTDDDSFECEDCRCHWPNGFGTPGEWYELDETQCEATNQPLLNIEFVISEEQRQIVDRCILAAGHLGNHKPADGMFPWPSRPDTEGTPA